MEQKITFKKLDIDSFSILKKWWNSKRVKEFWDNSLEMKEDVNNYVLKGQKTYYDYFIGLYEKIPYALIITSEQKKNDFYEYYKNCLSKTGKTYAIDFMIGNEDFVGKHLSSITLKIFIEQYSDKEADKFIIDPAKDNKLAFKCYKGAGFNLVGEYAPNDGYFKGKPHYLMVRNRKISKICFLFSGQGSQKVGMGKSLCDINSNAKRVFECASDVLGFDLLKICCEATPEELSKTKYSQPAIMAVSLAAFECLKEKNVKPYAVAGHSLGEYAAMVASNILSLEDGFRVIKARASAMQECSTKHNGSMCAVIGVEPKIIEQKCDEIDGYVTCVNYNSPLQTVVAGESESVKKLAEKLNGIAKMCIFLKVNAAFHSKLMQPAVNPFLGEIEQIEFSKPTVPFYSNLTGSKLSCDVDIKSMLGKHLISPVRFTDELNSMKNDQIDTYIELGPGKVLSGLVKKTLSDVKILNVEDEKSLSTTIANLNIN